ncbi:MAG: hypothetical protein HONBIEJF_01889 [Fimbriimonadaceae bacterium]|nr:hypothetical protein [Fimbriimonadaceae bacterium]
MVGFVAIGISAAALGVAVTVAVRMQQLRYPHWEEAPPALDKAPESLPPKEPRLQQLRVALAIDQDYPHPAFANLVREMLFQEDAVEVSLISRSEAEALTSAWPPSLDLLIDGTVRCNGYAEIYYEAEFQSRTPRGALCTLIERPPHGDRPVNLAIELVDRIAREYRKSLDQGERRAALKELGNP